MYVSQHIFTPVPERLAQWTVYNRNYMSLTARVPGALLSRILRRIDLPEQFVAIGIWSDREKAAEWTQSAENKLGAQPNIDQNLYGDYPMEWSRWTLSEIVWSDRGALPDAPAGAVVRQLSGDGPPDRAVLRGLLALLSRQPGFACGELHIGHKGDRWQVLLTWDDPAACASGMAAREVVMFLDHPDCRDLVLSGVDWTVWDWVPGPCWRPQADPAMASAAADQARTRILPPAA
jgi:hypothetical protein